MAGRILGIFLAGVAAELFLLIWAGSRFGVLPVFGALILSMITGGLVIRRYGLRSVSRLQNELQSTAGQPENALAYGIFGTIAGFLLILPGFLSDIAGLALLFPPVQRAVLKRLGPVPTTTKRYGTWDSQRTIIIEGEATEIPTEHGEGPDSRIPPSRLLQ